MFEIGSREKRQPAPPHVVWRSLVEPHQPWARPWLDILDDEVGPTIVAAVEPTLVVWSSIWPRRGDDSIRFDLRPSGSDTALRWTVYTNSSPPDSSMAGHMRHRMNVLINARLRQSYGQ